jgi:hypothetical protein
MAILRNMESVVLWELCVFLVKHSKNALNMPFGMVERGYQAKIGPFTGRYADLYGRT